MVFIRKGDPDFNKEIEPFRYVSGSKKRVCIGIEFGRYVYANADEVYPSNSFHIPVRNAFGSIDYIENPNRKPKR